MHPFLILLLSATTIQTVNAFTITATNWMSFAVEYTVTESKETLDIGEAASATDGQFMYLFGGKSNDMGTYFQIVHRYDPYGDSLTTASWSSFSSKPPPDYFLVKQNQYAQFNLNSDLYLATIGANTPTSSSFYLNKFLSQFYPEKERFMKTGEVMDMIEAQSQIGSYCAYVYDNILYLTGFTRMGSNSGMDPHFAYTNVTDLEDTLHSLEDFTKGDYPETTPNLRQHACVVYKEQYLYLFGGNRVSDGASNLPVYKCLPDFKQCAPVDGSEDNVYAYLSAVVIDQLIFVIGGAEMTGETENLFDRSIRVWDPSSDTWLDRDPGNPIIFNPYYGRINFHAQYMTSHDLKRLVIMGGTIQDKPEPDKSIMVISFTEAPTASPTTSPTKPPTNSPTSDPTMAPSSNPTLPPSMAPTTSPTSSCIAFNNETKHDGDDEMTFDDIYVLNLDHYDFDRDSAMIFHTSELNHFINDVINCFGEDCVIQCNYTSYCSLLNVKINDMVHKSVILYCDEHYSCSGSSVMTMDGVSGIDVYVICAAQYACVDMDVTLRNISSFHMYCTEDASCLNVIVDIADIMDNSTDDGVVECVGLNSCNNMVINTVSIKTQLIMYQFSDNVALNNSVGYLYDDSNIICNTNRYLKYPTSVPFSDEYVSDLILNEYDNQQFPCDDVHVLCGNHSCSMKYTVIQPPFITDLLTDTCYWINVEYFQRLLCEGQCISSPTSPPTSSPTLSPTFPTVSPSNAPSNSPTLSPSNVPSNAPSQYPSAAPSTAPSNTPSTAPSLHPSVAPTAPPTNVPSHNPSNAPSQPPTSSPTNAPTQIPSTPPTNSPTLGPSNAPTHNPSVAPSFSPTVAPSNAPTKSPTVAPTHSPTQSPTRYPTSNIEDIYDAIIPIKYVLSDLSESKTEILEDNAVEMVPYIISIIEGGYFVEGNVEYKDFMISLSNINGFDDLSNIALRYNEAIQLQCQIRTDKGIAGVLEKKSKKNSFEEDVTDEMRLFFGNASMVVFSVSDKDSVKYSTVITEETEEESIAVYVVSGSVVLCGLLLSTYVFVANYGKNSAVDNAKYLVPLLFSLQVYDFISDINLSYDILTNPLAHENDAQTNIIFLCGVGSVIFTVLPYFSNIYYGMRIKTQEVIKSNKRADAYFQDKIGILIAFIVFSGGCHPSLLMVSSRILNLDVFNSGLTKHELDSLTKIKIRSTICLENGPQLIIQILYSIQTTNVSPATFFAFVGSLLSVIMAIASYYAHQINTKEAVLTSYYLRFSNTIEKKATLTQTQNDNILERKGRKEELQRAIAQEFKISHESLEIGYVTPISNGLEMHVVHYLTKAALKAFNDKYNAQTIQSRMFVMDVKPKQYVQQMYKKYKGAMDVVFRNHFQIDSAMFEVEFVDEESHVLHNVVPSTEISFDPNETDRLAVPEPRLKRVSSPQQFENVASSEMLRMMEEMHSTVMGLSNRLNKAETKAQEAYIEMQSLKSDPHHHQKHLKQDTVSEIIQYINSTDNVNEDNIDDDDEEGANDDDDDAGSGYKTLDKIPHYFK